MKEKPHHTTVWETHSLISSLTPRKASSMTSFARDDLPGSCSCVLASRVVGAEKENLLLFPIS